MKKLTLVLILLVVISANLKAQIVFEKGYFVSRDGDRVEGEIKNRDWKNNPISIEFRLNPNSEVQQLTVTDVQEFGIAASAKYLSVEVDLDRSTDDLNYIDSNKEPDFKKEHLFLKVLVEGTASLLVYQDGNLTRYFYRINDTAIKPLVYKRYLVGKNTAENNYYRQQLWTDLKCEAIQLKDVEYLKYARKNLERFVTKYNQCQGDSYRNETPKTSRDLFNLSVRPGINFNSLSIENSGSDNRNTDFGSDQNVRLGIEAEFVLPYNKSKWAILLEPTYQSFKAEKEAENTSVSGGVLRSKVEYQSVQLPVGVRYYSFINANSSLYANMAYVFDFAFNSSVEFSRNDGSPLNDMDVKPRANLAFGLGYQFKNRYSVEARYYTNRELLGNNVYWSSDYTQFSLILGVRLF